MKYIGDMFLICAAVLAIAYFVQKKVAPEKEKIRVYNKKYGACFGSGCGNLQIAVFEESGV